MKWPLFEAALFIVHLTKRKCLKIKKVRWSIFDFEWFYNFWYIFQLLTKKNPIKNIEIVYISSWRVLYWAKIPAEPNWMKHVKFLWDKKVGWDLPKELKKSQYFRLVPRASTRFWNDNHTPEFQIFCRIWWSNRQTLNFLRVTR